MYFVVFLKNKNKYLVPNPFPYDFRTYFKIFVYNVINKDLKIRLYYFLGVKLESITAQRLKSKKKKKNNNRIQKNQNRVKIVPSTAREKKKKKKPRNIIFRRCLNGTDGEMRTPYGRTCMYP